MHPRENAQVPKKAMTLEPIHTDDSDDALTQLAFGIYGNPGVYALLLGSGLSRSAGIPTDGKSHSIWSVAWLLPKGKQNSGDWAAWYKAKFGKLPNYSELIAQLGPSQFERRAILNDYIEPTEEEQQQERKIPTRAHHAIAEIVRAGMVRVVITTNFDRLLEQALRERGTEPIVVDSVHAIQGAEPLGHAKCYLVKLHGDYKDARILNTDPELSQYAPEFTRLLDRIFDDHGLIVCGWSGAWDVALADAIMSNPSRRYSMYWAARGPIGDAAQRIIAHRRGHIISIADADGFFGKLGDRIQTLARTHRQNPDNVQLLVSTAKRFVTDHERRIDLHDLVESQVDRLFHSLLTFMPDVDATTEEIEPLVAFQESSAEPLARMFGVLGRWGDSTGHDSVVDALVTVWSRCGKTEPAVAYLRYYPAVLLLWAYGIGLAISKRWHDLHSLLSQTVDDGYGNPKRFVHMVSEWFLEGYRNNLWKCLPGLQDHHAPVSDHLYSVLNDWRDSFAAVLPNFEGMHDTWEILFALINYEPAADERERSGWAPVGRNGWRHQTRARLLARISEGDLCSDLVAAGLAGGSRDQLAANVERYAKFVAQLRWH